MEFIYGLIAVFAACIISVFILNIRDKKVGSNNKRSEILSGASNRNTYAKARDVFESLKEAGIEPGFLGGNDEQ